MNDFHDDTTVTSGGIMVDLKLVLEYIVNKYSHLPYRIKHSPSWEVKSSGGGVSTDF